MAIVFLYECPTLGLRVQGWAEDAGLDDEEQAYEAVACTACGRTHLVNPRTGHTLAARRAAEPAERR
jgi:DNA-directed RNA polymerase subunit RPC12/RpoP